MKRIFFLLLFISFCLNVNARDYIWPKGKMPDRQPHQKAAMLDESRENGFDAKKHAEPYLEWFEAPADSVRNGSCMILISGGGYFSCCDMPHIKTWRETLTAKGVQCVNFVYRTPRPQGLPFWKTAWEDGQRAVRVVRSMAREKGFDPERIGVISMSAGSHLALLLASSSQTPAYPRINAIDDIPCHINWGILNAPAYVLSDGLGVPSARQGYGPDVKLDSIFRFDSKTCPLSLHHGGTDIYSPNASTLIYRELRKRGIPAELHLYPNKGHQPLGLERGVEFLTQMGFLGKLGEEEDLEKRYANDSFATGGGRIDVWPAGKMPDPQVGQCKPYIEWFIPEDRKTDAIQIIYSGGAYVGDDPGSFEVAPVRRFLNERGVTVVTLKYRAPRPSAESGLAKHTTAWEDLQRAIRIVRRDAASKGLNPERIGIMGSSAGGHLTVMGVTSSRHQAYEPIDDTDKLPCNVQWGIGIYPAYVLSDGLDGHNANGGNLDSDILAPEFSMDLDTAPMLFLHGDADGYASMGSVKLWEKMRAMGVQSELHTLALRQHCFQHFASPGTGSYTWMDRIVEFLKAQGILQ